MDALRKQVQSARRRLALQRFAELLPRCWFATLLIVVVAVVVDRYAVRLVGTPEIWVAVALGIGLIVALGWTLLTRRGELDAALEIDRRYGLKERVSSALVLSATQLESPVAQALADDAQRRVSGLDLGEHFRFRLRRNAWLPIVPGIVVFLLAMFVEPLVHENPVEATTEVAAKKARVENSAKTLRQKLAERRDEAKERGLQDAGKLFEKLERETRKVAEQGNDQKQALVKLNDLAAELEKRRKQVGGSDSVREQLKQMGKSLGEGPADRAAEAIQQGDLKQAQQELNKLKDQLAKGQMDKQQQEQLAKQMDKLAKKLDEAAAQQKQLEEQLKKQLAERQAAGDGDAANEIERQLAKLAQRRQQTEGMKQLAEQGQQLADALRQGDSQGAADKLDQLSKSVEQMQAGDEEMEMLDAATDQITAAKEGLNGQDAENLPGSPQDGQGGQGKGQKNKDLARQQDGGGGKGGLEPGTGQGDRSLTPQHIEDTAKIDSRVRQNVGRGTGTVVDLVEGPNAKGDVRQQIQEQFEASQAEATDPLTGQQLSRGQRNHAKEYFDRLREGK